MATIPLSQLVKQWATGDPVKAGVWLMRDISNGDIIDTSEEFSVVRAGTVMTIRTGASDGCTVLSDTTLGVPAVGADDFGWLSVWGSAK